MVLRQPLRQDLKWASDWLSEVSYRLLELPDKLSEAPERLLKFHQPLQGCCPINIKQNTITDGAEGNADQIALINVFSAYKCVLSVPGKNSASDTFDI